MTSIDFGTVSLTVGGNTSTSGTLTATCSGTPNQTIEICANFGEGSGGAAAGGDPRYLSAGSSLVEYSLLRGTGGGGQEWAGHLRCPSIWAPMARAASLARSMPK